MTPLSYQLYSSRNFPPLNDTLSLLSKLGYSAVEGYGGMMTEELDASALRLELDKNSLQMPTCHIGLPPIQDSPESIISMAKTLGIETIYVPAVPESERKQSSEGWKKLGESLEEAAKPILDSGLQMGWHNHAFEFAVTEDGDLPLDLILSSAPSLSLELDIAWAVIGKHDALETVNKYADRLSAAHIKDIAVTGECTDEDGWADVGYGTMDWQTLVNRLLELDIKNLVMEHDNPKDHERFASRSIETINRLAGAR